MTKKVVLSASGIALLAATLAAKARPTPQPPPLTCRGVTDKAIVFMQNGQLNCMDGPLYDGGEPSAIGIDGIYLSATPSGDLEFSNLTGPGNARACLDRNGKLYRGDPDCG